MDTKDKHNRQVNLIFQLDLWADRPDRQAAGHVEALHGESDGNAFLLQKKTDGRMKTIEARPGRELPAWIREYKSLLKTDCYISQNSFRGDRRAVRCIDRIGAIWTDLDYYKKPRYKDFSPGRVYDSLQIDIDRAGIPQPSMAIYSGRGLYAVWLLERGYDLSHYGQWQRIQRGICDQLGQYGADRRATDGARILRLCSTENSQTGHRVKCFNGTGRLHLLKDFATVGIEEQATDTIGQWPTLEKAMLSGRLDNLSKLPELLGGCIPVGIRHNWILITYNVLAWLMESGLYYMRETAALLDDCPGYTRAEFEADRRNLDRRAKQPYGQDRGLFRFKSKTIRERLGLSVQWCKENRLYSLAGDSVFHGEANKEYQDYKRRRAGIQSRAAYIEQVTKTDQRERIIELAKQGCSQRQIGAALAISRARVRQILDGNNGKKRRKERGQGQLDFTPLGCFNDGDWHNDDDFID